MLYVTGDPCFIVSITGEIYLHLFINLFIIKDNHFNLLSSHWHHTVCFIAMVSFDVYIANPQWYNTMNILGNMTYNLERLLLKEGIWKIFINSKWTIKHIKVSLIHVPRSMSVHIMALNTHTTVQTAGIDFLSIKHKANSKK